MRAGRVIAPDAGAGPEWWKHPAPLGRGAALEGMAGIAAPLLAGFSLTLVGVIASSPGSFRWPGADLAVLVVPVVLLVACVQFGFRARSYLYSAADIGAWRPDFREKFEDVLKRDQIDDFGRWRVWERRAGRAYNLAICVLAVGVALAVAPLAHSHQAGLRWLASAVALAGGVAEAIWIVRLLADVLGVIALAFALTVLPGGTPLR